MTHPEQEQSSSGERPAADDAPSPAGDLEPSQERPQAPDMPVRRKRRLRAPDDQYRSL